MEKIFNESGIHLQAEPPAEEIFNHLKGKTVKLINPESGKTETWQAVGIATKPPAGIFLKKLKNGESSASTKIIPLEEFYKLLKPDHK